MNILRRYWVAVAVFLVGLLGLSHASRQGTLLFGWDAQFYYAAARSLVYDGDLDITNDLYLSPWQESFQPDAGGHFRRVPVNADGRIINKYPIGLTLIEVPLLSAGRGLRMLAEARGRQFTQPPGYSPLEVNTVAVGLLALFSMGMQCLANLLGRLAPPYWVGLSLLGAWLGTSLFYYSAVFPFMAHAAGFTVVVWLLAMADELPDSTAPNRPLLVMGLATAFLFLIRPQQVLLAVFLLPRVLRLWGRPLRTWLPGAVGGGLAFAVAVAGQGWVHAENTGAFTLNAYAAGGEGFFWTHPAWDVVLISPCRGLFWISPVVAVAALGYWVGWRSLPWFALALLGHAVVQLYLIAAWSSPHQGDAFGARMWCECTGVVACGLALLYRPSRLVQTAGALATAACVCWTCAVLAVAVERGMPVDSTYSGLAAAVLERIRW
jgi:hypothetical protein